MTLRLMLKRSLQGVALFLVFPCAAICGFGRVLPIFTIISHLMALGPGVIGNFLRGAFYRLTLEDCSIDTNISFGTYFVEPATSVAAGVSIGAYCVIARVSIGKGTQIASHVEITGGRNRHLRTPDGRLADAIPVSSTIGEYCWIGASAVVMASVGSGSTVGGGAVVVNDIPAGVVAAGNPARVLRARCKTGSPIGSHTPPHRFAVRGSNRHE
jgi:acetyltransferase-like isoleucine patch superfamily enzyme